MPAAELAEDLNSLNGTPWDMLLVLFVLALVIALIVWVLRFFARRSRGWWMNRSLRSLGGLALGTNKSLQIVEWNGRIYVLGVGEDVTLLDAITDPGTVAELLAEHEAASMAQAPGLPTWMKKALQGRWSGMRRENGSAAADEGRETSFEKTLEDRLRQLAERRQKVEQLLEESRSPEGTDQR
jgi:flagellar protein FliO/FliZ